MEFKRIYVEITNVCNLHCSFCPPHNRKPEFMSVENFEKILDQIRPYSDYLCLHVKGEPLIHPDFDKMAKLAFEKGFSINLATNGILLKDHIDASKYLRQVNVSLHATNDADIVKEAMKITNCYVNFRVWNTHDSVVDNKALKVLEQEFGVDLIEKLDQQMQAMKHSTLGSETNFRIRDNFFVSIQNEFEWPDLDKKEMINGTCLGLTDHFGILVDGTVVPCCLDNNGDVPLGNIFEQKIDDILNSERAQNIVNGFKNKKCVEELCQNCTYKLRFN